MMKMKEPTTCRGGGGGGSKGEQQGRKFAAALN